MTIVFRPRLRLFSFTARVSKKTPHTVIFLNRVQKKCQIFGQGQILKKFIGRQRIQWTMQEKDSDIIDSYKPINPLSISIVW